MNELQIPGSPNWYLNPIFLCAPDNTVIYAGSLFNITLITINKDSDEPANIETLYKAHTQRITAIAINSNKWGNPNKFLATVSEDNMVKLWDLELRQLRKMHAEHDVETGNDLLVGVAIAGERIISVTESGYIIIWQYATNNINRLPNIFAHKVKIRCMSACPHATWLTAFGLYKGTIILADLRKNGRVLFKINQHQNPVVSFSWCPTPINIFKSDESDRKILKITSRKINNTIPEINVTPKTEPTTSNIDDALQNKENIIEQITNVEIPIYEPRKEKEYQKVDKKNPWGNVVYDSDEETETNVTVPKEEIDFLDECKKMRRALVQHDNLFDTDGSIDGESSDLNETPKNLTESNYDETLSTRIENIKLDENSESSGSKTNIIQDDNIVQERFISREKKNDYLLASACTSGMIYIWRTSDGKLIHKISSCTQKNVKQKSKFSYLDWASVHWIKPDLLLASSHNYKIYELELLTGENLKSNPGKIYLSRLILEEHKNRIFAITAPFKLYPTYEPHKKEDLNDLNMWTMGKDRLLICTSLGPEPKILASLPTFGAAIENMAVSPIDPTKLAIGLTDASIRLWDLSQNETRIITMTTIVEKLKSRITYLDWHPIKENIIAFSTAEGKIGEIDTKKIGKPPYMYKDFHSSYIHRIQWGPLPLDPNEYGLYSISAEKLVVHKEKNPNEEPVNIKISDCIVTTFAWNYDHSILAVGCKGGQVKLLSNDFVEFETFYVQKSVQCVQWHPPAIMSDSGLSPFVNYLAICSNDKDVHVYNCVSHSEKKHDNGSEHVGVLTGHNCAVKRLNWSPHHNGKLLASAENGVVNIYDVPSNQLIASNKYNVINTYVIWSPVNPDLIISSNVGNTLAVWNFTKNVPLFHRLDIDKEAKELKLKEQESDKENEATNSDKKKATKKFMLTAVSRMQQMYNIKTCKKILELSNVHDEILSSSESDNSSDESNDDPIQKKGVQIEPLDPVQLFGARKDVLTVLHHEERSHINKGNWEQMLNIGLWRGDIEKQIDKALQAGVINPWMIQLAPMVSHQLYLDLCKKYADKLLEEGDGIQASSYYLLCHQVLDAIEALCKSNMYRDALVLAKCRLPGNDRNILTIYEKWAKYASFVGNFEEAAQCLIKINKLSEAGEFLSKRSNINALELAAELAKKSNNNDLLVAINTKLKLIHQYEAADSPILHVCENRLAAFASKANTYNDYDKKEEIIGDVPQKNYTGSN